MTRSNGMEHCCTNGTCGDPLDGGPLCDDEPGDDEVKTISERLRAIRDERAAESEPVVGDVRGWFSGVLGVVAERVQSMGGRHGSRGVGM